MNYFDVITIQEYINNIPNDRLKNILLVLLIIYFFVSIIYPSPIINSLILFNAISNILMYIIIVGFGIVIFMEDDEKVEPVFEEVKEGGSIDDKQENVNQSKN